MTGDIAITNSTLTVGTNLAVTGKIQLASGSELSAVSLSNQSAIVTCGNDFTMTTSSKLYVYASETNSSFPTYGGLVDIGGDMTIGGTCWVYPTVSSNLKTNDAMGAVLFRMNNLMISSNSGFNVESAGYAGGNATDHFHGYGPGGGYSGGGKAGGGGYGGDEREGRQLHRLQ